MPGIFARSGGYAVTGYWGMLTFGRFLLGFIANRLGNTRQIRFSTLLGLAGAVLLLSDLPFLPAAALGLIGFAFATFYPAMMHAAPERFDDATAATVIGYQAERPCSASLCCRPDSVIWLPCFRSICCRISPGASVRFCS